MVSVVFIRDEPSESNPRPALVFGSGTTETDPERSWCFASNRFSPDMPIVLHCICMPWNHGTIFLDSFREKYRRPTAWTLKGRSDLLRGLNLTTISRPTAVLLLLVSRNRAAMDFLPCNVPISNCSCVFLRWKPKVTAMPNLTNKDSSLCQLWALRVAHWSLVSIFGLTDFARKWNALHKRYWAQAERFSHVGNCLSLSTVEHNHGAAPHLSFCSVPRRQKWALYKNKLSAFSFLSLSAIFSSSKVKMEENAECRRCKDCQTTNQLYNPHLFKVMQCCASEKWPM